MIETDIVNKVVNELSFIEKEDNIKIIYACESGSRAWGFPSTDSDYDVRFLYLRKTDWYLSIDEGRDVIERPISDNLDISGWDLKKTLKLYRKSNPPLLEWLGSPFVYMEKYSVAQWLRDNLPEFYSPVPCMYHYLHMAEGNLRDYLKGEEVWIKKYFYVLRPVLACLWIERDLGPVPTEFDKLVKKIVDDSNLKKTIDMLVEKKKQGLELSLGPRIPEISNFIETEISRLNSNKFKVVHKRPDTNKLNEIFRSALREVWE